MSVRFTPPEGWSTALTAISPDNIPVAWAANVPFAAQDSSSYVPAETVRGLPPVGIAMMAIGPREYAGDEAFPELGFPIMVASGLWGNSQYEGQLAPNVSICFIDAMVGNLLLNVTVWFGTPFPEETLKQAANEVLATLSLDA